MPGVPQAASLSGYPVTRQILVVIGIALLSFGGIGIVVGLVWLTASQVHGTLPYIFNERAETVLIYMLPALLLVISLVGAGFIAAALSTPAKEERIRRAFRTHTRFHV